MMAHAISTIRRVESAVVTVELAAIAIALLVMLCAVVLSVVARTFSLSWPDLSEIALMSMSIIAFLGSAYAVRSKDHITLDIAETIPSQAIRTVLPVMTDIAIVIFSGAILMYGGPFMAYVFELGERTPELQLPMIIPVACLVGGAALSIFHVVCRTAFICTERCRCRLQRTAHESLRMSTSTPNATQRREPTP